MLGKNYKMSIILFFIFILFLFLFSSFLSLLSTSSELQGLIHSHLRPPTSTTWSLAKVSTKSWRVDGHSTSAATKPRRNYAPVVPCDGALLAGRPQAPTTRQPHSRRCLLAPPYIIDVAHPHLSLAYESRRLSVRSHHRCLTLQSSLRFVPSYFSFLKASRPLVGFRWLMTIQDYYD